MSPRSQTSRQVVNLISSRFFLGASLLLIALILTAYTKNNPNLVRSSNAFFLSIASPLVGALGAVESQIARISENYFILLDVQEQNQKFQEQIANLVAENTKLQEVYYQNQRLEKILQFTKQNNYQGQVVRVIAYSNPLDAHYVLIDRGSDSGIQLHSAVVDGQALVGLVTNVTDSVSTVRLISDALMAVDAMIQNGRLRGLVKGQGKGLLWTFLSSNQKVYLGSRVITSGFDELYPPGLVIGNITEIQDTATVTPKIKIQPFVDLDKLETLYVISDD